MRSCKGVPCFAQQRGLEFGAGGSTAHLRSLQVQALVVAETCRPCASCTAQRDFVPVPPSSPLEVPVLIRQQARLAASPRSWAVGTAAWRPSDAEAQLLDRRRRVVLISRPCRVALQLAQLRAIEATLLSQILDRDGQVGCTWVRSLSSRPSQVAQPVQRPAGPWASANSRSSCLNSRRWRSARLATTSPRRLAQRQAPAVPATGQGVLQVDGGADGCVQRTCIDVHRARQGGARRTRLQRRQVQVLCLQFQRGQRPVFQHTQRSGYIDGGCGVCARRVFKHAARHAAQRGLQLQPRKFTFQAQRCGPQWLVARTLWHQRALQVHRKGPLVAQGAARLQMQRTPVDLQLLHAVLLCGPGVEFQALRLQRGEGGPARQTEIRPPGPVAPADARASPWPVAAESGAGRVVRFPAPHGWR